MISYFERSKGRLSISEDSLTAMVFDHLKYLPAEMFWRILKRALYHDKLPSYCGELNELLFWEKWNVIGSDKNNNKRYVEPDIFIQYENFDIIVEAKRYNQKQQNHNQLAEQIYGYYFNHGSAGKQLFYIQVGGLYNKEDAEDFTHKSKIKVDDEGEEIKSKNVPILKTDWTSLLNSITVEAQLLENIPYSNLSCHSRLLKDLINGFELFQFYNLKWLKDLKMKTIPTVNFKNTFKYV